MLTPTDKAAIEGMLSAVGKITREPEPLLHQLQRIKDDMDSGNIIIEDGAYKRLMEFLPLVVDAAPALQRLLAVETREASCEHNATMTETFPGTEWCADCGAVRAKGTEMWYRPTCTKYSIGMEAATTCYTKKDVEVLLEIERQAILKASSPSPHDDARADKGVPVAELEDLKRQILDVASAPIMKSTTKTQLDKGYELALRAAYRDFADELQTLISRHQDPHHG